MAIKDESEAARTYRQLRISLNEMQIANNRLQTNLAKLANEHKQICKDEFIFEQKDWFSYPNLEYARCNNGVAKKAIGVEDRSIASSRKAWMDNNK